MRLPRNPPFRGCCVLGSRPQLPYKLWICMCWLSLQCSLSWGGSASGRISGYHYKIRFVCLSPCNRWPSISISEKRKAGNCRSWELQGSTLALCHSGKLAREQTGVHWEKSHTNSDSKLSRAWKMNWKVLP